MIGSPIYIETWEVCDSPFGDRLAIAYSDEEWHDSKLYNGKLIEMEYMHECKLVKRLRVDRITETKEKSDE